MIAAQAGHDKIVQLLLNYQVQVEMENKVSSSGIHDKPKKSVIL